MTGNDTMYGDAGDDVVSGGSGDDVLCDVYGKNTNKGGSGFDTITDFSKEDVLDLRGLTNGTKFNSIGDVVAIKEDGQSSHVCVNVQGAFVEVAVLEELSAEDMLHNGMILT